MGCVEAGGWRGEVAVRGSRWILDVFLDLNAIDEKLQGYGGVQRPVTYSTATTSSPHLDHFFLIIFHEELSSYEYLAVFKCLACVRYLPHSMELPSFPYHHGSLEAFGSNGPRIYKILFWLVSCSFYSSCIPILTALFLFML